MRAHKSVDWAAFGGMVGDLARRLSVMRREKLIHFNNLFGVPTGGGHVAIMLGYELQRFHDYVGLTSEPGLGTLVVDDICDSGRTLEKYADWPSAVLFARPASATKPTVCLEVTDDWVVFPYEKQEEPGVEVVERVLQFLGEDPRREGLRETPARVARAWQELFGGYRADFNLTTFEDGTCDEVVAVRDIQFISHCEHHMLPFYGRAHVGYLPHRRIVGLSKLARVVDKYARRLQVQERMTQEIAHELLRALDPRGVAVVVEATHFCMVARGVRQPESTTVTSAMLGAFRDKPEARAEFMALIGRR